MERRAVKMIGGGFVMPVKQLTNFCGGVMAGGGIEGEAVRRRVVIS